VFDFCSVESAQPPEEKQGREAGGWEAESFLDAWRGFYTPPTQHSHSRAASALRASAAPFVCLLPLKGMCLYKYIEYGMMWHNVVLPKTELF